jgi:hypothetical protein
MTSRSRNREERCQSTSSQKNYSNKQERRFQSITSPDCNTTKDGDGKKKKQQHRIPQGKGESQPPGIMPYQVVEQHHQQPDPR